MKRNAKTKHNQSNKKKRSVAAGSETKQQKSGAKWLGRLPYLLVTFVIAGALGLLLTRYVASEIHEHDLARINNGIPTIVQIHDPQCNECKRLQKEARAALEDIDPRRLDYVVANLKTTEGRNFATGHGVQHVTLLLFDAEGKLKQVLQGQRTAAALRSSFQQLL